MHPAIHVNNSDRIIMKQQLRVAPTTYWTEAEGTLTSKFETSSRSKSSF